MAGRPRKTVAAAPDQEPLPEARPVYLLYAEWLQEELGREMDPAVLQFAVSNYAKFQASEKNQARLQSRRAEKEASTSERATRRAAKTTEAGESAPRRGRKSAAAATAPKSTAKKAPAKAAKPSPGGAKRGPKAGSTTGAGARAPF